MYVYVIWSLPTRVIIHVHIPVYPERVNVVMNDECTHVHVYYTAHICTWGVHVPHVSWCHVL